MESLCRGTAVFFEAARGREFEPENRNFLMSQPGVYRMGLKQTGRARHSVRAVPVR